MTKIKLYSPKSGDIITPEASCVTKVDEKTLYGVIISVQRKDKVFGAVALLNTFKTKPYQTIGGKYKSNKGLFERTATLTEIYNNFPFKKQIVVSNKRTGLQKYRAIKGINNLYFKITTYDFTIRED